MSAEEEEEETLIIVAWEKREKVFPIITQKFASLQLHLLWRKSVNSFAVRETSQGEHEYISYRKIENYCHHSSPWNIILISWYKNSCTKFTYVIVICWWHCAEASKSLKLFMFLNFCRSFDFSTSQHNCDVKFLRTKKSTFIDIK